MKILLVSSTSEPHNGWGRYTRDLARALTEQGHEVRIVCDWLSETGQKPLHDPDKYLGYSFSWLRDRITLRKVIDAFQPDVVHVTVEPHLSIVPLSRITPTCKLILTVHGTYAYYPKLVPFFPRILSNWLYARALRRVTMVTPVSHNTHRVFKDLLVTYRVPVPPITVIHNGVWMRDHLLPRLSKEEKGQPTILSVGAIKVRKGIFEVLEGIAALKKQYGIAVTYRIVGSLNTEDAYVKRLRAYAVASGIADQLVFTGRVSDAQVEDELRRAHILALLPREVGNLLEGFGLVYLEANAYGVPALGARGTVSEEAIREGESGVLVDAASPDDIARGIKALLDDVISPVSARAWAEEHDWSKIVVQYRTVYEATK